MILGFILGLPVAGARRGGTRRPKRRFALLPVTYTSTSRKVIEGMEEKMETTIAGCIGLGSGLRIKSGIRGTLPQQWRIKGKRGQ